MSILSTRKGRLMAAPVVAAAVAAVAFPLAAGASATPEKPAHQHHQSQSQLERNKKTVVDFYTLAENEGQPELAVKKYVGDEYIQHSPLSKKDGPEDFIERMHSFRQQYPQMHTDIRTVIAEGDKVVTHSLITTEPGKPGVVAADIFRLDHGKIVEHWDIIQAFPTDSPNPHAMF